MIKDILKSKLHHTKAYETSELGTHLNTPTLIEMPKEMFGASTLIKLGSIQIGRHIYASKISSYYS
jgi:hypothetical protein